MNVVGIDIGGTFTDLVGCVDGRIVTSKTSTVPADPTRGVADSLALAHCRMPALDEVLHGSTIAINTVLERKGARTALITTSGFRDIYAIGRGNRIEAFNLFFHRPKPLIPRELTFEVPERINAGGEVLTPLDDAEVEQLVATLGTQKVEAVAVCLLHAYANPAHERRVGEILRAAHPQLFVTLSHEIVREYREYERTSTTALNAFVGPRVQGYLRRLEDFLRTEKFGGKINIMRSNGGVMSIGTAQEQPVAMMESGPVAGMIGAGRLAALLGLERAIGFDMGGTTAKTSLITDGAPAIEEGYVIGGEASGQPMQLPVVDIVEVGAGGGSIAWFDAMAAFMSDRKALAPIPGLPRTAKASSIRWSPMPISCSGASIPTRFLNGTMRSTAARPSAPSKPRSPAGCGSVCQTRRLASCGLPMPRCRWRCGRCRSTRASIRAQSAMIAFGGGGPLHAVAIAREIFVPKVVVPKVPGTFSALGMLMAAWRQDFVRTLYGLLGKLEQQSGRSRIRRSCRVRATADSPRWHGVGCHLLAFFADLRYVGQEHTIPIPVRDPKC